MEDCPVAPDGGKGQTTCNNHNLSWLQDDDKAIAVCMEGILNVCPLSDAVDVNGCVSAHL